MQKKFIFIALLIATLTAGIYLYYNHGRSSARTAQVFGWFNDTTSRPDLMMTAGTKCGDAPFIFPTDGLIGFIWDDSFRPGHRHSGLDIFAGTEAGVTPIVAAYPGYLTRQSDWISTVIIRVPDDPLQAGRQIWVYYTHMADPQGNSFISPEFPAGTEEVYVEAGTFLGYQGNYSGDSANPTGVHLHISVVQDDFLGNFKNELEIENTHDPSPYFGLPLNANLNPDTIPVCN
ncbi:MAG: M23 family metallopeptidase [Anaerolineales bacterium]|nr:M23 family metallopeptidase [Anaerolineales bacterium]